MGRARPSATRGGERSFRPNYRSHLIPHWIPALEGVEEKLRRGARVADVGCGRGTTTILLAQAYPVSRFFGFDAHTASIEVARQRAEEAGVADRVAFAVARATDYPGTGYELVAHINPVGRMLSAASTMICVPASLAKHGPALGGQAGEARIRALVTQAGFMRFRRATQTRFNLEDGARP